MRPLRMVPALLALAFATLLPVQAWGRGREAKRVRGSEHQYPLTIWTPSGDVSVIWFLGDKIEVVQLDRTTGERHLVRRIGEGHVDEPLSRSFAPSINGRWFVWANVDEDLYTWEAAETYGERIVQWPNEPDPPGDQFRSQAAWTNDRHRWIEIRPIRDDRIRIIERSVLRPGWRRVRRGPRAERFALLGVMRDQRVTLISYTADYSRHTFQLIRFRLRGGPVRRTLVRAPEGRFIEAVAAMPGGDLLAWVFTPPDSRKRLEFWLSRADGSGMRHIAEFTANDDYVHRNLHLQWLPDRRHVSFHMHNPMWTQSATWLMRMR
jgi:hypothetical protein